jgi:hypothetical protein
LFADRGFALASFYLPERFQQMQGERWLPAPVPLLGKFSWQIELFRRATRGCGDERQCV